MKPDITSDEVKARAKAFWDEPRCGVPFLVRCASCEKAINVNRITMSLRAVELVIPSHSCLVASVEEEPADSQHRPSVGGAL